jgi:putative FmdB family regulatory protein
LIIKDYECRECGNVTEHYVKTPPPATTQCPECNGVAEKIVTISQTIPIDAAWIHDVLAVVDKSGKKPHCNEFLKHPTRANMKAWMKGEGLRHRDPGEPATPKVNREARKQAVKREVLKSWKRREAVTIG